MIDPHTLKPGDKIKSLTIPDTLVTPRGKVFTVAAGCVVIQWTHTTEFDPIRLTSLFWRYIVRDDDAA